MSGIEWAGELAVPPGDDAEAGRPMSQESSITDNFKHSFID
jgi:hypothetical protein